MLTPAEQRVLDFFRDFSGRYGHPPLLREVGEALGVRSKGSLHRHVRALIEKGYLQEGQGGWRGIALITPGERPLVFPLLGRIAAGRPIEAIAGEDEIDLASLLGGSDTYVLQIAGDSMIGADILDGDLVFLRRRETAEEGDIVSALIDGEEATLKRFRRHRNGLVLLIPENPAMKPVAYDAKRVAIQGVLIAKLRLYA
ncbi:MAG: transcriptional repressor LexA [Pseudomonadota bacterium]|nr:repressor LexA [Gammaproteobacteria bacterium]MDQ3583582.1 transcriptional repressor LexA [Pseudomonadota bacterium]